MLGENPWVPGGRPAIERRAEVARAVPVDRLRSGREVDAVDREPRPEELSEDPQDVAGDLPVQHQRACADLTTEVPVAHPHQPEVIECDRASGVPVHRAYVSPDLSGERIDAAGERRRGRIRPSAGTWRRGGNGVRGGPDDRRIARRRAGYRE